MDDFRAWLLGLGSEYDDLCAAVAEVEPYFESLFVLRDRLAELFALHLAGLQPDRLPAPTPGG